MMPMMPSVELQALLQAETSYAFDADFPETVLAFRAEIAPWIYRLCESFQLSEDCHNLSYSILNCLDRFMASLSCCPERQLNPQYYRLAAITCLYTIVKTHCVKSLSLDLLCEKVASGQFTTELMERMELQLLTQLQWKLHPITPMDFVKEYLEILFEGRIKERDLQLIKELCSVQIHSAMRDFDCMTRNELASHVALAALANALECVGICLDECDSLLMLQQLAQTIDVEEGELLQLRRHLYKHIADYGSGDSRVGAESNSKCSVQREKTAASTKRERLQQSSRLQRQDSPRSVMASLEERSMQF